MKGLLDAFESPPSPMLSECIAISECIETEPVVIRGLDVWNTRERPSIGPQKAFQRPSKGPQQALKRPSKGLQKALKNERERCFRFMRPRGQQGLGLRGKGGAERVHIPILDLYIFSCLYGLVSWEGFKQSKSVSNNFGRYRIMGAGPPWTHIRNNHEANTICVLIRPSRVV